MTNLITLTIPNDDHVALRAFGKALEEMALAHARQKYAEDDIWVNDDFTLEPIEPFKIDESAIERLNDATSELMQAAPHMMEQMRFEGDELQGKRKDTTAQQVESLTTNVVQREVEFDNPPPETSEATIDKTGTPWDERIHSTSKALNADGSWRLRRKPKDMDEAEWAALVESVKAGLTYAMESFDEQVIMEEDAQQKDELQPPLHEVSPGHIGVMQSEPPVTPSALFTPENYVHMYRAVDNIYALAKSNAEIVEFEADGYVRHSQEQYSAWEGPSTVDEGDDFHGVTEQTVAGIPPIPVPPPVVVPSVNIGNEAWDFPKLMKFLTERHGKIDVPTVNQLLAVDGLAALSDLNAHPDKIGPFVARVKEHLGE